MKKRLLLITGIPGIGKTTVLLKTIDLLRKDGIHVGGMVSREVRVAENRVGFEVVDIENQAKGWLAHVNQKEGPQIGKYRVNINDLNVVGVGAIEKALKVLDTVVVDEIGPMELLSQSFRQVVTRVVESRKLAICTLHWRMKDTLIDHIRMRVDANLYEVTMENRENLFEMITADASNFLNASQD